MIDYIAVFDTHRLKLSQMERLKLEPYGWQAKVHPSGIILDRIKPQCPLVVNPQVRVIVRNNEDYVVLVRNPNDIWGQYSHELRVMSEDDYDEWAYNGGE